MPEAVEHDIAVWVAVPPARTYVALIVRVNSRSEARAAWFKLSDEIGTPTKPRDLLFGRQLFDDDRGGPE
jgi:hypothetical protein